LRQSPRLPKEQWGHQEDVIARFEEAWRRGERPRIEDYLGAEGVARRELIVELIHADLECRLKAGEPARVETYLEKFGEIASDRESALGLIAAEYRLRRRLEAGLTLDEFVRRFPQVGDELPARLETMPRPAEQLPSGMPCPRCHKPMRREDTGNGAWMACPSCGGSFRWDPGHRPAGAATDPTRLAHFELLEEIGQGAFGTVYRARDTELDRTVAVKVPRGSRWVSAAEEERFVREGRSAARLAHPGIVPVYEAGRSGDVPYIVSAFVEGTTLAKALSERRIDFREAADLAAQVAEALDHAHANGVVHRDLKPSNVMLGRLAGSRPKPNEPVSDEPAAPRAFVMDFGLARRDEGEATVTIEGQVLGTPAYMSPEQARGEGHRVDGRSDVYSLGVILYELLTGELPFRGSSRMMMQQILAEEPRPPRRLNDKIPRDLDTITMKCLAKEPGRRYAGAGALAADLRRFLKGEPIRARPVGRVEQLWRWARRNPWVAGLSAAVLVLLLALAAGSTVAAFVFSHQRDAEAAARREATKERFRAVEDSALTRETLDQLVFEIQSQLEDKPALFKLRENLLNRAIAGLERYARTNPEDPPDFSKANAHERLGDLFLVLGRTADARREFETFHTIAQSLASADPNGLLARQALWAAYSKLGQLSLLQGDVAAAHASYQQAVEIADARSKQQPDDVRAGRDLSISYNNLGNTSLRLGEVHAARQWYAKALKLVQQRAVADPKGPKVLEDLSLSHEKLGDVALLLNDPETAREEFLQSLSKREAWVAASPESVKAKRNLAAALEKLGNVSLQLGDEEAAETYLGKCKTLREGLASADAENTKVRRDLALSHARQGDQMMKRGDPEAARLHYLQSLQCRQELAAADPRNAVLQRDLSIAHERLGDAFLSLGDARTARENFLQALLRRRELAADPRNVQAQTELAATFANLGRAEVLARDFTKAADWFGKGVDLLQRLSDEDKLKNQPVSQNWLKSLRQKLTECKDAQRAIDSADFARNRPPLQAAQLLHVRAMALADRGQHAEAAETVEEACRLIPDDYGALYDYARCYAVCAAAVAKGKPADNLSAKEAAARARYAGQAVETLAEAIRRGFKDVARLETDPDLASVRQGEAFRKLIDSLKAKLPPAKPDI
jgi:serine/threonine protein kinase/tetratricopeptide (TPR) repeat protein